MTCGVSIVRKVPDDKVNEVVANFKLDTPQPVVVVTKVGDNDNTVMADYGPCADESYPTTAKDHPG